MNYKWVGKGIVNKLSNHETSEFHDDKHLPIVSGDDSLKDIQIYRSFDHNMNPLHDISDISQSEYFIKNYMNDEQGCSGRTVPVPRKSSALTPQYNNPKFRVHSRCNEPQYDNYWDRNITYTERIDGVLSTKIWPTNVLWSKAGDDAHMLTRRARLGQSLDAYEIHSKIESRLNQKLNIQI